MTTPIRSLLALASPLIPSVLPGLKALSSTEYIDQSIRVRFSDSLDLDKALQSQFPEDNRWDYLLGLGNPSVVVGLEAHTAHTDQVSVVIAKRAAAIRQLRGHMRKGRRVGLWLWVASGRVDFDPYEKARRRLEENGIMFVGKRVLEKHLR